ncbi:hypothetical protein LZ32DRAFT_460705 [Colletotrichum eremochloae]|nr:hypothetical protein LZ32DRAFT_460705 [Colletotrichum eremochloae]
MDRGPARLPAATNVHRLSTLPPAAALPFTTLPNIGQLVVQARVNYAMLSAHFDSNTARPVSLSGKRETLKSQRGKRPHLGPLASHSPTTNGPRLKTLDPWVWCGSWILASKEQSQGNPQFAAALSPPLPVISLPTSRLSNPALSARSALARRDKMSRPRGCAAAGIPRRPICHGSSPYPSKVHTLSCSPDYAARYLVPASRIPRQARDVETFNGNMISLPTCR